MKIVRRILMIFCFCVAPKIGSAQAINGSVAGYTFGSTTELQTDSFLITLNNPTAFPITVTGYRIYTSYGVYPFTVSNSGVTILAGGFQTVWVYFHPNQNIFYNSELVVLNDGHKGPLTIDLKGQGHFSNAYYDSTENLTEEALKLELRSITGVGYRALGYSPPCSGCQPCARDTMFMIIDNQAANGEGAPQNTIECVYTGRLIVGYVDRAQCQDTAAYYNFNTEHTWPQSLFNQQEPMRSDLHHLFPTDETANGKRSNFPFGMVNNPSWSNGGSKFNQSAGIFEPRDAHKGEVARAMFYFVTRYQNFTNFLNSQEATLRQWNKQFPPTALEESRCSLIQTFQKNRNPFVDYPQFADRIHSFSTLSIADTLYSLDLIEDSIHMGNVTIANSGYNYVVVNNGNQPITFDNFTVQPSAFDFAAGFTGTPATVQPGDALSVPVVLTTTANGFITGRLNYTTTDTTFALVTVPIDATVLTSGISENSSVASSKIVPNPTSGKFCIQPAPAPETICTIRDLSGRVLTTLIPDCNELPSTLSAGMYFVELQNESVCQWLQLIKVE